jgi:hypothetical protein
MIKSANLIVALAIVFGSLNQPLTGTEPASSESPGQLASQALPAIKVGLFGTGLETYWGQFEGLLPRLEGYQKRIHERLASAGADVNDAGMVDNIAKAR